MGNQQMCWMSKWVKYLMSEYYIPYTVLDAGNAVVHNTGASIAFWDAFSKPHVATNKMLLTITRMSEGY